MRKMKETKMTKRKKNSAAVALGRLGGKARLKKLTARKRSEVARIASLARWAKEK